MLFIILFIVVGSLIAYIAQFNLTPVTVNLGYYVSPEIPLFYVIVGSFLTGLILAYLFYLVNSFFARMTIRSKNAEIKETRTEVVGLTKRVHQLEIDNERLRKQLPEESNQDDDSL